LEQGVSTLHAQSCGRAATPVSKERAMQKPDHVIQISRRDAIAVTAGITGVVFSSTSHAHNQGIESNTTNTTGTPGMNHVRTKDGTEIFFKDWGKGQPVVFSHGWPLSADDWDAQMFYFASRGFRCIAHDRRGHGRSTQTWDGNNMDTYADDLMDLVEKLDLKQAIHVGHSTGGGEVARYVGRHGAGRAKGRIAKAVLIGAVPPIMVKSANNPVGLPKETFDGFRASLLADRAQFFRDGIAAFSETDFTEDLKRFNVPTLIMHSEDDQIVPIAGSAMLSSKLVPGAALKVYKGFGHGMCSTHHAEVNPDLLAFFKA
jgi:non-heme chloroperoxidase